MTEYIEKFKVTEKNQKAEHPLFDTKKEAEDYIKTYNAIPNGYSVLDKTWKFKRKSDGLSFYIKKTYEVKNATNNSK